MQKLWKSTEEASGQESNPSKQEKAVHADKRQSQISNSRQLWDERLSLEHSLSLFTQTKVLLELPHIHCRFCQSKVTPLRFRPNKEQAHSYWSARLAFCNKRSITNKTTNVVAVVTIPDFSHDPNPAKQKFWEFQDPQSLNDYYIGFSWFAILQLSPTSGYVIRAGLSWSPHTVTEMWPNEVGTQNSCIPTTQTNSSGKTSKFSEHHEHHRVHDLHRTCAPPITAVRGLQMHRASYKDRNRL